MEENLEEIKVVLAGSAETGKSNFLEYITDKNINFGNYFPTIGLDFGKKILLYKKNIYSIKIFDTSGQIRFQTISKLYMKNAHIFLIFFNYNDRNTFEYAKTLFDNRENEKQVFVLIGAKYDLKIEKDKMDNIVNEEEVLEYAKEKNALYAHLSLLQKYSNGVIELVKKSFDEYINRKNMK